MLRQLRKYYHFPTFLRLSLILLLLQLLLYIYKYPYVINNDAGTLSVIEETGFLNGNFTEYQFLKANFSGASEGSWQYVGGITEFKFLVYSAYLDIRITRNIRVIAVTRIEKRRTPLPKIWCKLWYKEGYRDFEAKTVQGEMKIIKEHWNLPYSAYYIMCPLAENDKVPDAVSVLSGTEQMPENILKVIVNYGKTTKWDPDQLSPLIDKMAVCVKPLHYDYNRVFELLEFIELHRMMGVDHFFLYNHTVGPQVSCLLEKYQNDGIVSVLPWQLPIISQKEIRTEGIFASLNDCLFRTMHTYSHAIFVDFDEFIIPTNHSTYRELFEYFNKQYSIKARSTFSFKNAFFYRQWPDDPSVKLLNDPIAENLIVLKKTTRKTQLHAHRTRSKLIVRPELVHMVGNHFIWEYYSRAKFGTMDVNPRDAFLHHYRVCEFGGDDCVKLASTVDRTVYRYKDELIKAVKDRYNTYLTECKLENITDFL